MPKQKNQDEKLMSLAIAHILSSRIHKSKKGMLGNFIGGFIVILVGISLLGTISQEIDNSFCGANITIINMNDTLEPNGATDSFGGGGATHFGGYDGTVKHDSWLSNLAIVKTNESYIFNGEDCIDPNSYIGTIANMVPGFFAFGILIIGLGIGYTALKQGGLLPGPEVDF